jgi:alcohol dehydrogenase class IV
MVKSFNFARLPEIYFGCGKLTELPPVVNLFGKRIILVTGNNSFMSSVKGAELLDRFRNVNISFSHVSIKGEPSPEIINETVADLSAERYDAVVAIGGGSVVDAGKAISAMMYRKESVTEFLEVVGHKVHPGTKLPFIAVPTTSGTGSEATKNAVISRIDPAGGFKRSLRHDNFVPDFAIVDPMLTVSCTRSVTAASGMDCFTQLTESFLSVKSNPFTDSLLIEGLKKLKSSLRVVCSDGGNIEARTGMSFAALTSGICLANAGLGAVHGFASSLGGIYNMPHGLI